ncbi:polysaccharide biosynthesis/export family protein [Derxia gummosa]|uniref:Polysaccharide biosynthesis/export family protein n=1 Tax=Derxia gummosa DSM 723 TaxID=1121388 RepID=A0A8B6X452_9BURK|nr:polysaccharide biosynthesis/export family protein [Derxia gummosa]
MPVLRPALLATVAVLALGGCASPLPTLPVAPPRPPAAVPTEAGATYRIVAGDQLMLRFDYQPDQAQTIQVAPDGGATLPWIGWQMLAGRTLDEVSRDLTQRYASVLKRPDTSVNLATGSAQRVFVGGEVGRSGAIPLNGRVTVTQALLLAEGLRETAATDHIVLLRPEAGGAPAAYAIDLRGVLDGSAPEADVVLRADDVLVVPRSGVANVNLWVDQYIRKNLPVSLGLNYNLNPSTKVTK